MKEYSAISPQSSWVVKVAAPPFQLDAQVQISHCGTVVRPCPGLGRKDTEMNIEMRRITSEKVHEAVMIWNKVVEDGVAFPQTEPLDDDTGAEFFAAQDYTAVAFDTDTAEVVGMYILHPNNVGRCGHICNASYAVRSDMRGKHIGELLVTDCLKKAKELGYKILQFNAVVATNTSALELYKKLGFVQLGVIPGGFLMKDGHYEDIIVHYHTL